jgi:hypothetical protein
MVRSRELVTGNKAIMVQSRWHWFCRWASLSCQSSTNLSASPYAVNLGSRSKHCRHQVQRALPVRRCSISTIVQLNDPLIQVRAAAKFVPWREREDRPQAMEPWVKTQRTENRTDFLIVWLKRDGRSTTAHQCHRRTVQTCQAKSQLILYFSWRVPDIKRPI